MTDKGVSQTLGSRLAQARRELSVRTHRDITQADVAAAVGASGASMSRWEADTDTPREPTLEKLAAFLGTTPQYLRYGVRDALQEMIKGAVRLTEAELDAADVIAVSVAKRRKRPTDGDGQ